MLKTRFIYILLFFILYSCQKRDWNNPFDPECPKEIFTPSSFVARQLGDSVVLSWNQANTQISGFVLEKNTSGGNWIEFTKQEKTTFTIHDPKIEGGINYGYKLYAYAGSNNSNSLTVEITPELTAKLVTTAFGNITSSSATVGGNISSNGGSPVTERGVCYSTIQNPTINSTKLAIGNGTGSFSNSITTLLPNTIYYVRAYATNAKGIAYGNQITFTTLVSPATLITSEVTTITSNSAICGGIITSNGGLSITESGICYSTSQNPTIANTKMEMGTTVIFSNTVSSLLPNTTYYVRAYANNGQITVYGNEVSFKTFGINTVTDFDGNVYNTVTIGTQVWMVENLKTTHYNDGTTITYVTNGTVWLGLTTGAYCFYNNDVSNKDSYGALYNWYTINTNKLAPIGWHVPSDAEWTILKNYLGGENVAGGKLKENGQLFWMNPNTGANNISGFYGLPGGSRGYNGGFYTINHIGFWWSSTGTGTNAWTFSLDYNSEKTNRGVSSNDYGYSVRCIKGEPIFATTIPTLSTNTASNITVNSAILGGTITSDGGSSITAKGVCWSTTANPTIANSKTINGIGSGSFISNLTSLTVNTTYYARAYASNSQGTAYGNEVSFKTSAALSLVSLTINIASGVTSNAAFLSANITSDGNATITERGICYSTNPNPTTSNIKVAEGSGAGYFGKTFTGFLPNTTYYVRAYAINSQGTAYSNEVIFKTLPVGTAETVTDIDGNVYNTVTIGTQVWMAENLSTTKYNDGTNIPNVTDNTAWNNLTTPGYCWYNNDATTYKNTYGGLYNWYAVNTGRLAPVGWHVPSLVEWTTMVNFLGGETVAGNKLKEAGTTHWWGPNKGATNETGFTGLPGGYRQTGGFVDQGRDINWWTSTEYDFYNAWNRALFYDSGIVGTGNPPQGYGFYVRCVRDY